ncbi:hypothetical protein [Psychroserpens damuponensis]|uniref:hypothetical protein n=1 Tax=Psychroserpens damuponensis TaxID=943936 RepID=UPI0005914185|nr:hypothetical protein [Psychroserpens damuponensis]
MKKSTLLSLSLSLIMTFGFNIANAQDDAGSNQALMDGSGSFITTLNQKSQKAIGSPYLYENFTIAKISATPTEVYNIRYNAYTDEVEVKVSDDKVQNFNKSISNVVITFIADDLKLTPLNYINSNDGVQRGYFVPLTENNEKVKLFSKKQVVFYKAKPAVTGYDKDKPAEFKNVSDSYFISIQDAYARELPKKKKDLAKLFPKHSKEVLSFIKKNRIKTSREEDLIQLTNYVNTL